MAAYNNYFPQTYTSTPYVYGAGAAPAQTWMQPTPTQTQAGAISWVQGEAGARSVPVQPYSRAGSKEETLSELKELMNNATDEATKMALQEAITKMNK